MLVRKEDLFRSPAQNDENAGSETISDSLLPCSSTEEKMPQCTSGVMSGRRVVELGHIAKQMECTDCNLAFSNIFTKQQNRKNMGFILLLTFNVHATMTIIFLFEFCKC